ncbi:MAG: protein sphX, partial [Candidatus Dadabacteria bacterium]
HSLKKPAVNLFVNFYLDNVASLISEVGYIPLSNELYTLVKKRFKNRVLGSMFSSTSEAHKKRALRELLLSHK